MDIENVFFLLNRDVIYNSVIFRSLWIMWKISLMKGFFGVDD